MFRTFFTAATLAALVASNLLAAQDDPSQKDREEQTLEDAIERATIRIRERVNVVGTDKALETIPGAAYALEGEERLRGSVDERGHVLRDRRATGHELEIGTCLFQAVFDAMCGLMMVRADP